jgi:hypothetical protein
VGAIWSVSVMKPRSIRRSQIAAARVSGAGSL